MNKRNKLFVIVFAIGFFAIFNGAYIKINGNQNADIILSAGMVMELLSILGLIFSNINKIRTALK